MTTVRLLFIGTGAMARAHAERFALTPGCTLAGAVDVNPERARDFAETYGIPCAFESVADALAWDGFDAVVNATSDGAHKATTLPFLAAGKPVFCEKPLAPNRADALEMAEAAEAAGVINIVNLTYRNAAALQTARRMIEAGEIGTVRHVHASYLQSWLTGRHWGDWRTEERWLWRLSSAHGSRGVLGDLGIHILDFACYVAGQLPASIHCRLKTFAKAENDRIGDYELDANDSFVMSIEFDGGALGVVHSTRWAPGYANAQKVGVYGSRGGLEIWFESEAMGLKLCAGEDVNTQTWREVECPPVANTYRDFVDAVLDGVNREPSFRYATELQNVLDLAFESDRLGKELSVAQPAKPQEAAE